MQANPIVFTKTSISDYAPPACLVTQLVMPRGPLSNTEKDALLDKISDISVLNT